MNAAKPSAALRMKLPHGETDPRKTYSMPDPDALAKTLSDARHAVFTGDLTPRSHVTLTYFRAVALVTLAEGYMDLTTYELGQGHCVATLRDIWRKRRAT